MMAHSVRLFLCLLALASMPATSLAQDGPPRPPRAAPGPRAFTLQEALVYARDHAPTVLSAMANAEAARAQVDVTRSSLWPTLSASILGTASIVQGTAGGISAIAGVGVPTSSTPTGNLTGVASLDARWTIWDFGRTRAATRAAEAGVEAAVADSVNSRRVAMEAVANAFFNVLSDQETVVVSERTLAQRRAQLEITTGLVEIGTRPPIERTRSQVAYDSAALDLQIARGTLAADIVALCNALAIDPRTQITLVPPPNLDVPTDLDAALERAMHHRADVQAAQARVAQAEESVSSTNAAYAPSIAASASFAGRATDTASRTSASATATGGISLNIPIIDGAISARTRAAEANRDAAQQSFDALILNIRATIAQAAISVTSARAAMEQSARLEESAAADLLQAQGRYQAGVTSLLELVDAQAGDANARVTVVRLRAAWQLANVRLLSALGELETLTR
ncbi:MAG: TolC family protein [Sandaracinaceae bacterium]|nr:TolC family protein [Sandaracinaceae bacterium]